MLEQFTISSNLRYGKDLKGFIILLPTKGIHDRPLSPFYLFIFISWRLITLQYCSSFCHTLTWISHGFTCILHPDPPSHLPLHPIPLGLPSAPALSTCLMHPTWAGWWSVSPLTIYMFRCRSLWTAHPCLLPQSPKVCSVHLCLFFCFAYWVIVTIFLNSIYMCVLVYCISLYLSG